MSDDIEEVNDEPIKVLVVENDRVNQRVTQATLEHIGFEVDVAGDGDEAIKMATRSNYKIILMDCHMPIKDGYDATQEIREMSWGEDIRIIALTADVRDENIEKCFKVGMDDFVKKTVSIEELKEKVLKWLSVE